MKNKDYYRILGLKEDATPEEIKKAFRLLAIKFHPDRNAGDPKCEERFKAITEAYGVLIDPVKRKKYDLFRSAGHTGGFSSASGFKYSQADIFEDIFNNPRFRTIFEELNQESNSTEHFLHFKQYLITIDI